MTAKDGYIICRQIHRFKYVNIYKWIKSISHIIHIYVYHVYILTRLCDIELDLN